MFDGFEQAEIDVGDATINLRRAGDGPPLLLLHGYPQTHVAWHKIAPLLKEEYSVVVPDLRGYGDSRGPSDPGPSDYSNRVMAGDMLAVMERLGYETFRIAGHDRGARVGYRFALDYPEHVEQLAVLDITPTLAKVEAMDYRRASESFHWLFLAQPHPFPETMISRDPTYFVDFLLESWAASRSALAPEAVAEYHRAYRDESVIRAACEDYRAGLSIDLDHDRASRAAGAQIEFPLLVLWGQSDRPKTTDTIAIWERWAGDVRGRPVECGHFLMEEAPEPTFREFDTFFT